jgi:hypothetical protein
MKILRKRNKTLILLVFIALFACSFVRKYQANPSIDIKVVKNDMIKFAGDRISENFISNTDDAMFGIFYIDNFSLVHLSYKDVASEAFMKSSIIALYHLKSGRWKFKKIIPYNYEILLLNKEHGVFLSDNEFCSPSGSCSYYSELSIFRNEEMQTVCSYNGFDSSRYYDWLISIGKTSKVAKVPGDTIVNIFKIDNVNFSAIGVKSYNLQRQIGILTGISDTFSIKTTRTKQVINTH